MSISERLSRQIGSRNWQNHHTGASLSTGTSPPTEKYSAFIRHRDVKLGVWTLVGCRLVAPLKLAFCDWKRSQLDWPFTQVLSGCWCETNETPPNHPRWPSCHVDTLAFGKLMTQKHLHAYNWFWKVLISYIMFLVFCLFWGFWLPLYWFP
jgi:hypothetical protein